MFWPKLTSDKIRAQVMEALSKNSNYRSAAILGIPGTYLDAEVFYDDAPFLENAPFLSTLIANPNHIGCHTIVDESEKMFQGTQALEKELINICAEQIFSGEPNQQDGYVASGGTEANIEAMWIYRNYFIQEYNAKINEIGIIYSEDSHYSLAKASNLLNVDSFVIKVDELNRSINAADLVEKITTAKLRGIKYFIVNANLSTTMFGSVDDINVLTTVLNEHNIHFKLHIDAAFGGFIYSFTNSSFDYTFKNPHISSITIDAHKMMQTPYGTGIFLIRKNYMQYVCTQEAQYVRGKDHTLCGSRSGANAIAIWMLLHNYGSEGWKVKMQSLVDRTTELCNQLDNLGVHYFRNPYLNIITIQSNFLSPDLAEKFHLVPDKHDANPSWYKIVMMPHIKRGTIDQFISDLKSGLKNKV